MDSITLPHRMCMAIDQTWIVLKAFVNLLLFVTMGENVLKYQLSLISFNIRYDRVGKIQKSVWKLSPRGWFSLVMELESESQAEIWPCEKKNWSRKHSHKCDRVRRIRMFPFSSDSAYDSVVNDLVKTRLSESEAGVEGLTNNNAC